MTPIFYSPAVFDQKAEASVLAKMMQTVVKLNPMYHFVEYFRNAVYRNTVHKAELETLIVEQGLATDPQYVASIGDEIVAVQKVIDSFNPVSDALLLSGIGFGALLVGAIIFMATKRKFIYSI